MNSNRRMLLIICLIISYALYVESKFSVKYSIPIVSEEMQLATNYAFGILDQYISTTCTINIEIEQIFLENRNIIADCVSSGMYLRPDSSYLLLPISLYIQSFSLQNQYNSNHIVIRMNTNYKEFIYFGIDGNPPSNHMDYVTMLLHETMHGLGIRSFFGDDGYYYYYPHISIYDYYIFCNILSFPLSSPYPLSATTLLNDNTPFFFHGNDNNNFQLYKTVPFKSGTSLSHAMSPQSSIYFKLSLGESKHCLTLDCIIFLKTVGYNITENSIPCISSTISLSWMFSFLNDII